MRLAALLFCLAACGGGGSKTPTDPAGAGAGAPVGPAIAAGAPYGAADEAVGRLALNLPQERAIEIVGPLPADVVAPVMMEATGEWIFVASYPEQGLIVTFGSTQEAGPFAVSSITVEAPSTWATPRGIAIGSAKADVERVYAGAINTEEPMENTIVVNSVYGGVLFGITDDKVSSIFVGAASE